MNTFQTAMKSIATAMSNICKSAVTVENSKRAIKTSNSTIKDSVERINEVIPEAHKSFKVNPSVLVRFSRKSKTKKGEEPKKTGGAKCFMNFNTRKSDGSSLSSKAEGSEFSLNQEFLALVKTNKGSIEKTVTQWVDIKNSNAYAVELLVNCLQAGLSIDDSRQQVAKILHCVEKNVPYVYGKEKKGTVVNLGTFDIAKLVAKDLGEKTPTELMASLAVTIQDTIQDTLCTAKQIAKAKNCKGRTKQAAVLVQAFDIDKYSIDVKVNPIKK